jgi:hypothetical protein
MYFSLFLRIIIVCSDIWKKDVRDTLSPLLIPVPDDMHYWLLTTNRDERPHNSHQGPGDLIHSLFLAITKQK